MRNRLSAALLLVCCCAAVACSGRSDKQPPVDLGQATAVQVNGKAIDLRQVETILRLSEEQGTPRSREELITDWVMNELYYQEAIKRGLQVTQEEAAAFADQTRAAMETADNSEQAKVLLNVVMESMEMTEEEYWAWSVEGYRRVLSVANLKQGFLDRDGDYAAYEALGKALYEQAEIVCTP